MLGTDEEELPRYLLRDDVAGILRAAARKCDRDLAALLATYKYGLRVCELVGLNRSDVSFQTTRIKVRRAKGSITKELPLLPDVACVLRRYLDSRADEDPALIRGPHGR